MQKQHKISVGQTYAFCRDSHPWDEREIAVVKLIRARKLRISLSCDIVKKFLTNSTKCVKSIVCLPDELF